MNCRTPGFPVPHQLPGLAQTQLYWVTESNQLSHLVAPFSCLQSFPESGSFPVNLFFPSLVAKYCSFSFSIGLSNEYSGLISFRMDQLDLLEVQGTLKSLLQHPNSKASILRCSAFFIVQLSYSYVTTGKIIALTVQTFVSKVMSLLLHMLSRLVIAFFQGASVF